MKSNDSAARSLMSRDDLFLFNEGSHFGLYEKMGAHPGQWNGKEGTRFAVWAPDAQRVWVKGDFNFWERGGSGIFMYEHSHCRDVSVLYAI